MTLSTFRGVPVAKDIEFSTDGNGNLAFLSRLIWMRTPRDWKDSETSRTVPSKCFKHLALYMKCPNSKIVCQNLSLTITNWPTLFPRGFVWYVRVCYNIQSQLNFACAVTTLRCSLAQDDSISRVLVCHVLLDYSPQPPSKPREKLRAHTHFIPVQSSDVNTDFLWRPKPGVLGNAVYIFPRNSGQPVCH